MFFKRNIPAWERMVRLCVGIAIVASAFAIFTSHAMQWVVMAAGMISGGTGFFGFCPMCALFGWKLNKHEN